MDDAAAGCGGTAERDSCHPLTAVAVQVRSIIYSGAEFGCQRPMHQSRGGADLDKGHSQIWISTGRVTRT